MCPEFERKSDIFEISKIALEPMSNTKRLKQFHSSCSDISSHHSCMLTTHQIKARNFPVEQPWKTTRTSHS